MTITDPFETELTVVPLTADPVARMLLSVAVRGDIRGRTTGGVCLVDISTIPDEYDDNLASLMRMVTDRLERDPWDLADHPHFRFAVAQRYKIRARWRYWSRLDTTDDTMSSST